MEDNNKNYQIVCEIFVFVAEQDCFFKINNANCNTEK